jgi:hypothetical protein
MHSVVWTWREGLSGDVKDCLSSWTREIDANLLERQIRMADDNFLAEKDFDISLNGQTHKVKATAVFLVHDVAPQERGIYILNFTLGGQHAETTQPDKTYYSREEARQAVERAVSSGEVEAYVKSQIQSWINVGY